MFHYVYQLRSTSTIGRRYVGLTQNLKHRLDCHNSGVVNSTAPFAPWEIEVAIAFQDEAKAIAFEKYLKTHSGRSFAKRHF